MIHTSTNNYVTTEYLKPHKKDAMGKHRQAQSTYEHLSMGRRVHEARPTQVKANTSPGQTEA